MDRMIPVATLVENAKKVSLKAPVGEIFVEAKRKLNSDPDSPRFCCRRAYSTLPLPRSFLRLFFLLLTQLLPIPYLFPRFGAVPHAPT